MTKKETEIYEFLLGEVYKKSLIGTSNVSTAIERVREYLNAIGCQTPYLRGDKELNFEESNNI